jgi:hypothetical protein
MYAGRPTFSLVRHGRLRNLNGIPPAFNQLFIDADGILVVEKQQGEGVAGAMSPVLFAVPHHTPSYPALPPLYLVFVCLS